MCGRYVLIPDGMKARYDLVENIKEIEPNYNVAPGQFLPIITRVDKQNQLKFMKWGLIPNWANDIKIGYKMINARAETILEKPTYKKAFKENRCLVPISGFYEWKKIDDKQKIPFFIHLKDEPFISLAGVFDYWQDPFTHEIVPSFSIITTSANTDMSSIHHRMPVILDQNTESKYLESDPDTAYDFLKPTSEKLDIYQIDKSVNKPENNSQELLKKVELEEII